MVPCRTSFDESVYVYMYPYEYYMASKNISITEDVYDLLVKMKLGDESFSQTIRRLASERRISDCAGLWSDMSDEEEIQIRAGIRKAKELAKASIEAYKI